MRCPIINLVCVRYSTPTNFFSSETYLIKNQRKERRGKETNEFHGYLINHTSVQIKELTSRRIQ